MADVGGTLSFDDIGAAGDIPVGLPHFIPQLDANTVETFDTDLRWGAYALGLRRWLSPTTHELYPRYNGYSCAREALRLPPEGPQMAVLVGYGQDPLVEAFWARRAELDLVARLAEQRWDLVLAPNFSMYTNQPRAEHLLNFRRNLLIAAELAAAGVPAVPNIYWFRKEDLDRYLAWVADVGLPALAVNLQTFRTEEDWATMAMPGLTYLSMGLPEHTKVVLTGGTRPNRLADIGRLFGGRWWYISQKPVQAARHGRRLTAAGEVVAYARPEDLFASNVRFAAGLVAASSEHPGPIYTPAQRLM
jgi:hypothetical protein